MDRMFRPFFVGRMANNAPSRRVVSEARAKPGFQLVLYNIVLEIFDSPHRLIVSFQLFDISVFQQQNGELSFIYYRYRYTYLLLFSSSNLCTHMRGLQKSQENCDNLIGTTFLVRSKVTPRSRFGILTSRGVSILPWKVRNHSKTVSVSAYRFIETCQMSISERIDISSFQCVKSVNVSTSTLHNLVLFLYSV
jgi:hypothetical protein